MKRLLKVHIIPFFVLMICLLLFFWPVVMEGKMYSLGGVIDSDFLLTDYPSFQVYRDYLLKGHFPWWVSSIGEGYPLVAGGVLGAFYPLNIIFYSFLNPQLATAWLLFFHASIAAIGAYLIVFLYTRQRIASIFSGLSFALSGFMVCRLVTANLFETMSLFPLVLFFFLKALDTYTAKKFMLLVFILSLQILIGYLPLVYYELIILLVVSICQSGFHWKIQLRSLLLLGAAVFLALGLTAVQLVPTVELHQQSPRASGIDIRDATYLFYPKEGLLSFLAVKSTMVPLVVDLGNATTSFFKTKSFYSYYSYIGFLPLFFLPFGLVSLLRQRTSFFLIAGVGISLLLMLGDQTSFFGWFWKFFPGMQYFRYTIYFLGFFEFFLVLLGGMGLATVYKYVQKKIKKRQIVHVFFLCILFLSFVDLFFHNHAIQPTQDLTFWLKSPSMVEKIKLDSMQQRVSNSFNLSFNDRSHLFDWSLQQSFRNFLPANYNLSFGIPMIQVREPLVIERQSVVLKNTLSQDVAIGQELIQQKALGKSDLPIEFSTLDYTLHRIQGVKYIISPIPLQNPFLRLSWQFAFPHTITLEEFFTQGSTNGPIVTYPLLLSHGYVYELIDYQNRAQFLSRSVVVSTKDDVAKKLTSSSFLPTEEVILEANQKDTFVGSKGFAHIDMDTGEKVRIQIESAKGGWLYLADTYYPGWRAFIDGRETKIYLANYAFRAIKVTSPGKHIVEFVYDPLSRKIGMGISMVTGVFLLTSILLKKQIKSLVKSIQVLGKKYA